MNRDKYLENLEIKNRRLLLKIYKKHIEKLKIQIYYATEKGNDTTYLQNLHNQVEKQIIQFEKDLKQYSASAVKTSYESGAKTAIVGEVAKEVAGTYAFGSVNREAMQVLAKTTYQPLSKMAQQIGRATLEYMKRENFQDTQTVLKALGKFVDSEFLRKTGVEGIGNVVVGSESWQTAAKKIRDKIIAEGGLKVPYYNKKGGVIRYVNAQDYAKMVSRTTTANVFREGAKDRILEDFEDEGDLVEIINKSNFPNSPCIPYQGQILSLEGRTKGYTTIKEAKANGLFHPNCIHSFAVTKKVMQIYDKIEGKEEKPKEEIKANKNAITPEILAKPYEDISQNDKLIQELKGHTKALDDATKKSIQKYTTGWDGEYLKVNGILRGNLKEYEGLTGVMTEDKIKQAKEWINDIDKAMDKSPLPQNMKLYRGISNDGIKAIFKNDEIANFIEKNEVNENNLIKIKDTLLNARYDELGYMSTSYAKTSAYKSKTRFTVNAPQNLKGILVEDIGIGDEREMLLERNTSWNIKDITVDFDVTDRIHYYNFELDYLSS